jgi:hypothetical protein
MANGAWEHCGWWGLELSSRTKAFKMVPNSMNTGWMTYKS